ncbi:hypothetical protein WME98_52960 [Sorangium sp. So ce296]|uniref:hypothetical protein n=1 Tax=Sorangium sp. So ce296 TaxID=3133296 RepID=UPI003F5F5AA5
MSTTSRASPRGTSTSAVAMPPFSTARTRWRPGATGTGLPPSSSAGAPSIVIRAPAGAITWSSPVSWRARARSLSRDS